MRAKFTFRPRFWVTFGVLLVATILLAGCAPTSAHTGRAASKHAVLYRTFATFPHTSVLANAVYSRVDGIDLRMDVCQPVLPRGHVVSARPAILVIHGGSWELGDKSEPAWRGVCRWLASSGFVAASVDYRLSPKYPYPDGFTDVEHAVEWLREPAQVKRFSIDARKIGAFGGSAGGNLAALLGTDGEGSRDAGHRVAAVVELSGPANLTTDGPESAIIVERQTAYLGCKRLAACPQARSASPMFHADSTDPPFFIGNSSNELIPIAQSTAFVRALQAAHVKVTFVEMPGDKHSISMLDPVLRAQILTFFHTTLVQHSPR
ncbi:MAG TPA: alpha/beta hydrolase [Galbitalea sp.]|jgi:acetyl esterase/lipase